MRYHTAFQFYQNLGERSVSKSPSLLDRNISFCRFQLRLDQSYLERRDLGKSDGIEQSNLPALAVLSTFELRLRYPPRKNIRPRSPRAV